MWDDSRCAGFDSQADFYEQIEAVADDILTKPRADRIVAAGVTAAIAVDGEPLAAEKHTFSPVTRD
ncbi:hypothetical protein C7I87_21995 [Mesorhizobium sp. SARCC-RB16n]|uniref:hypothetical protein n=1 Tax=Mesorhizobium sp. SARCC-RB16n TaxID=2116687 RepID=UPI00122F674B|nr:hypothetical protein [Mesorhizobium sp. SARCC-RB16n]KAA3448391.1 hypothetical protein C7I87_21995 [Mesorhizobium sp. SARCC-RB16n]